MKAKLTLVPKEKVAVPVERRQGRRMRVLLSASIAYASSETRVTLREVSPCDALVDSPVAPAVGSYVLFRRGPVQVRAQLVRREGRLLALDFLEEVDETVLLISIGKSPLISKH
jgi:hypothetical protein